MPSRPTEVTDLASAEAADLAAAVDDVLATVGTWVNLLPEVTIEGVDADGVEVSERVLARDDHRGVVAGVFAMLVASRGGAIPFVTVVGPAKPGRAPRVGVEHATGPKAAPRLAADGLALPQGWRVVQDHPRTGLVVEPPVDVPATAIAEWVLAAVARLSPWVLTGRWVAERYGG